MDDVSDAAPEAGPTADTSPSAEAWIVLNGERRLLSRETSLLDLLRELQIVPETPAVAIAVNDRLIRRADWPAHRLAAGDRIEVVRPMAGG
jgi:sulfur carrier protein